MPFLQVVNLDEYYGLAIKLANEAHNRLLSAGVYEIERQELIQEGFRGLVEAGNRYDPKRFDRSSENIERQSKAFF